MRKDIVFLSGVRTAFGAFGGTLKDISSTDLCVYPVKEALNRAGVSPEHVDHFICGRVITDSSQAPYQARHTALKAGIPVHVPAYNVNRLCTSGFQAIVDAAMLLQVGEGDFIVAAGTESMSRAPHVLWGARFGIPLGQSNMTDFLMDALTDGYAGLMMALTAEKLGEEYGISREAADEYAYRTQIRAKEAIESGRLAEEIVPVEVPARRGKVTMFGVDEHPRPDTTLEGLARLNPYFKKDGVVTAGNASGICDGAGAMVLTTMDKVEKEGLRPIGRLVDWTAVGVEPSIMGIGPAPASRKVLEHAGLSWDQLDVIEINEAFAVQYLAVEKELELDREKVNVNGGAVAIGHPIGATGIRLTTTLLYELRRRGGRYGLASACAGGGQGMALIVEALP